MKIHNHAQAGLLVIDDLPTSSKIEIRDWKGQLKKKLLTITPSISIDTENWISGWYELISITPASQVTLQIKID
jgi:hypothetical protein